MDNAPSHPHSLKELSNIKVLFFPPNATSVLQPLDQGVIQNVKTLYKKRLLRHVLTRVDSSASLKDIQANVSVLDACQWISSALKEVKDSTVNKCFKRCGFKQDNITEEEEEFDEEDDLPLSHLITEVGKHTEDPLTASEYEEIEDGAPVMDPVSDLDHILADTAPVQDDEEPEDDQETANTPVPEVTSASQALKLLDQLKGFCAFSNNADMLQTVMDMQDDIQKQHVMDIFKKKKQTSITQFFSE